MDEGPWEANRAVNRALSRGGGAEMQGVPRELAAGTRVYRELF